MGQRIVRMELKYCERCGGLLLRRSGEAVVYCGPCDSKLRDLPPAPATIRIPPQRDNSYTDQEATRRQA